MPMLEVRKLSVRYGPLEAVRGIDFVVEIPCYHQPLFLFQGIPLHTNDIERPVLCGSPR